MAVPAGVAAADALGAVGVSDRGGEAGPAGARSSCVTGPPGCGGAPDEAGGLPVAPHAAGPAGSPGSGWALVGRCDQVADAGGPLIGAHGDGRETPPPVGGTLVGVRVAAPASVRESSAADSPVAASCRVPLTEPCEGPLAVPCEVPPAEACDGAPAGRCGGEPAPVPGGGTIPGRRPDASASEPSKAGTAPGLAGAGTGPGLAGAGTAPGLAGAGTAPGLAGAGTVLGLAESGTASDVPEERG
jgi:hypothetical protein